ncbi:ethanolamine utilization protein EutJ [Afifella marina]|uniref:Ethanolamine utilization protein EutJ n=1 Tax=Afifella marina DSM 2698 TaxID=1120955 RepID=A0A1G5NW51_AFIMA|nr:ethanolamine utilization protein EutJ [Afifella marina]MBK1624060.1 ethanolamine utilization protein EutJ [Afifella marina DSM 2698]MBK1627617.1 ethanolamine utilization protein EutJ [Afifella marina]MBK5916341.1 ethanolamine utilization protein EutJ [Afifella marina]RAI20904.1 ethanolamine utilization protein EutJ [Afifella marina DSM 2698]SCZ41168.1 ethanolamine utilization protein EutJ [Afifella marina DSM 2698]
MNSHADDILARAVSVFNKAPARQGYKGRVHVGVDLGTAYTVLVVLDEDGQPLAGRYQFAQIVRDGLVVDFIGAMQILSRMKAEVEADLGFALESAATSYPPGVAPAEVKATQNVVIGAGLECEHFVDEPTAANALLQIKDGAVVDVGGGTTGVAIFKDGEVVYTADEATGGTQFTLVLSGALGVSFEEAENIKKDPKRARSLYPLVRPVMQKVGSIVAHHIAPYDVKTIHLVGGTSGMPGMADIVAEMTGIPTKLPSHPMFVTPIGIAMHDREDKTATPPQK